MIRVPHRLVPTGLALVLLLLGAAPPAGSDDAEPADSTAPDAAGPGEPAPEPPPAAPDTGRYPQPTLHGELQLSLADAIRMGLENNLDVDVDRYTPYIAGEEMDIAWGAFDPRYAAD